MRDGLGEVAVVENEWMIEDEKAHVQVAMWVRYKLWRKHM